jgi:DNA-binding CsgD family transcriptional regulator
MMQDNQLLTRREAEVCTGIVLGYTILGLSMNLGISVNTVATHRKRAYAKLRISSQNELFTPLLLAGRKPELTGNETAGNQKARRWWRAFVGQDKKGAAARGRRR